MDKRVCPLGVMAKIALDFYGGKKVFLTGHTGFKGAWLCRILLMAGAEITGYALGPPTKPSLFVLTGTEKDIHSITGDVRNRDALIKAMQNAKPDIVFHLAAQPIVRFSYREPALTYETNVMGTVNVFEALRLTPSVRSVVNVTTDKVYENKERLQGYSENENLCGYDPYSNSKSCSDLITYSYRNSFFYDVDAPAISTARSGNVIGGGDYAEDRIIPDCVRAASEKKEILIRNPHSVRPYQHVLDCLTGYLQLAEKQYNNKTLEGAYNFGPDNEGCAATESLVEMFCAAWGPGAVWRIQGDGGPQEANFLKLDCLKSKAVLGWKPLWDIQTAVVKTIEFSKMQSDTERLRCVDMQIREYYGKHHI